MLLNVCCGHPRMHDGVCVIIIRPKYAVDIYTALQDWSAALQLAKTMAPENVPDLSARFAVDLEHKNELASVCVCAISLMMTRLRQPMRSDLSLAFPRLYKYVRRE